VFNDAAQGVRTIKVRQPSQRQTAHDNTKRQRRWRGLPALPGSARLPMTNRYTVKPDPENEQFKIIDTGTLLGTEDMDHEWVATAYDPDAASHLCALLNRHPHSRSNR